MVELNEKALEAAHHTYQTHEQMGDLKAQRLSDSCLTAVITAYFAALPAPDDGLAAKLSLFADHLFPAVLEYGREIALLREAATALQSQADQIERLTRENEADRLRFSMQQNDLRHFMARAEAAEQQVQKLTAENERQREALTPLGALAAAVFRTVDGVEMNAQKADDAVVWSFDWVDLTYGHLRAARSALEAQEDGK